MGLIQSPEIIKKHQLLQVLWRQNQQQRRQQRQPQRQQQKLNQP